MASLELNIFEMVVSCTRQSHTLLGGNMTGLRGLERDPGMVPRAVKLLFRWLPTSTMQISVTEQTYSGKGGGA